MPPPTNVEILEKRGLVDSATLTPDEKALINSLMPEEVQAVISISKKITGPQIDGMRKSGNSMF